MGRNERRGLIKVLAAAGLAGVVIAGTALAASAMIPKPGTIRIQDGFTFSNLTGYQSPGASGAANCNAYAPGTPFSFSIDVRNGFGSRDQQFNLQVFKMVDLDARTCFTEAQLEHMVVVGHDAGELQVSSTNTAAQHFDYGTTRTLTAGSTPAACGYYQFDFGTPRASYAPSATAAANDVAPVSGFVLYGGCATAGVSGTTTTTTTTTGGTSAAHAATLATTGGGAGAGLELLGLLIVGSLSLMGGVRLLTAERRRT